MSVGWGILGAAGIARDEVGPALRDDPRSEVRAVASRSVSAAAELGEALGADATYDDYDTLLRDDAVEAVYVPLPNALHLRWVLRALAAGKHVLCEKPLGLTPQEVGLMSEAAMASGRHLAEAFMWRHHPWVDAVDRMLDDGRIGAVTEFRVSYRADMVGRLRARGDIRLDPNLGGGALNDLGSYCVDALTRLARGRAASVRAAARWDPSGVDVAVDAAIAFDDGMHAALVAAMDQPGGGRIDISGTDGTIQVDSAFRLRVDRDPGFVTVSTRAGVERFPIERVNQYSRQVAAFVATVLDDAAPTVPLAQSLASAELAEAIRRACADGGVAQLSRSALRAEPRVRR